MNFPLKPLTTVTDPDDLMEHFLEYALAKGIELYPAQEEAILELFSGKNVILNTPTGSGKSLVAAARQRQPRRSDPVLHRRDPRKHRPSRR